MFIKGFKDYNKDGNEMETGMVIGRITTAGELKTAKSGKHWASAGIKVCNNADGSAKFMTLKSFGNHVDAIASLQKGDSIMAAGTLDTHEYNGKRYTDMIVEFMMPGSFCETPMPVQRGEGVNVNAEEQQRNFDALKSRVEFTEDDSSELPF